MLCRIYVDKTYGDTLLTVRIGETAYTQVVKKEQCLPMDFIGCQIKDFTYVVPEGFQLDSDLEYWIQLTLNFNPFAKAGKKVSICPSRISSKKSLCSL